MMLDAATVADDRSPYEVSVPAAEPAARERAEGRGAVLETAQALAEVPEQLGGRQVVRPAGGPRHQEAACPLLFGVAFL